MLTFFRPHATAPTAFSSPGGQGACHSAPLLHNGRVVSPVGQHLPCRLPVRRRGEAAGARQQPHLEQHRHQFLRQLLRNADCNRRSSVNCVPPRPMIVGKHGTGRTVAATVPPTVGGASNVSLTRSRKSSSTSQVSLTMETDSLASFWTAVRTCWHSLMWFRLCCSGLQG